MRHIIIEQAIEGESYYQATIEFGTEKVTGAKQHLENLLYCLEWTFDSEFTYELKLVDIPVHRRRYCADFGDRLTANQRRIGEQIAARHKRSK